MRIGFLLPLAVLLATTGCAGSVEHWIATTRVHQGDAALQHGSAEDAATAYRLALTVEPQNQHARDGFVESSALLAQEYYATGDFDEALTVIDDALKVDPASMRLAGFKNTLDQAKLKREIVMSNYPNYSETGLQITHAYGTLDKTSKQIVKSLQSFNYTFNTDDLTKAIKQSYELQLEIAKNTNRLISYRQLVQSGVPEAPHAASSSGAASILPLP